MQSYYLYTMQACHHLTPLTFTLNVRCASGSNCRSERTLDWDRYLQLLRTPFIACQKSLGFRPGKGLGDAPARCAHLRANRFQANASKAWRKSRDACFFFFAFVCSSVVLFSEVVALRVYFKVDSFCEPLETRQHSRVFVCVVLLCVFHYLPANYVCF